MVRIIRMADLFGAIDYGDLGSADGLAYHHEKPYQRERVELEPPPVPYHPVDPLEDGADLDLTGDLWLDD